MENWRLTKVSAAAAAAAASAASDPRRQPYSRSLRLFSYLFSLLHERPRKGLHRQYLR